MTTIKNGDTVRIHYTGTLTNGETFDSSDGRDPLEFVVGSGQIIPGLDRELPGMVEGDQKTVTIPCDLAYGPHDPDGLQAVEKSQFPEEIPLEIGTQLQVQTPDGQTLAVSIAEVRDEDVILDANHPLAGKDLTFDFTVVEVTAA